MQRRTFVELASGAVAAVALPGCASLVATPVTPVNGVVRLPLRNFPQLEAAGGYLRIRPDGQSAALYVVNAGAGRYTVLSPICTHLQCTVGMEGSHFLCPCHGSMYDREGQVLRGPAERALQRFPAEVGEGGELVIRLGGRA